MPCILRRTKTMSIKQFLCHSLLCVHIFLLTVRASIYAIVRCFPVRGIFHMGASECVVAMFFFSNIGDFSEKGRIQKFGTIPKSCARR